MLLTAAAATLTMADYVFKAEISAHVPREQLGEYFATIYFVVNVLSLMVQLFGIEQRRPQRASLLGRKVHLEAAHATRDFLGKYATNLANYRAPAMGLVIVSPMASANAKPAIRATTAKRYGVQPRG